jgi:predicted restriction endonuclease
MADYLWGPKSQELSFELIYFLDKIVPVTIHRAELNRAISYSENYIIQSFVVLSATQSESVLNAFPVLSSLSGITAQEYRVALDGLQSADSLDRKVDAFSRVEQTYLRQLLFPTPTARCAICGNELPIDLLVAGHIKKRSACSLEEKKDAQNIVMPICGLGCDELFERGYISVDADGAVVSSKSAETATLASLLSSLRGRRCSNFRPENEQYFQWHFNTVYRG